MGAARAEDARQATAPVLGTVLRAMESVPLCVSPRLKVLGSGNLVEGTLVYILLHGSDEVAEQHLGRRRLDAVRASVRVLERRGKYGVKRR